MFKETLEGKFVTLRKTKVEDAADIYQWRSGASGKYLRQTANYSVEAQQKWIESRSDREVNYIIFDKFSNEKVGTISIYDVNEGDKVANVGRLLLADTWLTKSNPYGLEAMILCYAYVFKTMQFRKITGDIIASNVAMVKLQLYLGMEQEGLLSKHVWMNGEYQDLHIMSLFSEDFDSRYTKRVNIFLKAFDAGK
jgi:RimJ/RimL family protein N-acetyltransferase